MVDETERLVAMRGIAERAGRLCDRVVGRLERRGLAASGGTPEAASADRIFKLALLGSFLFARDLFRRIAELEASDSVAPAQILGRCLFEAALNVIHMNENPQDLGRQFVSYEAAQRYKSLRWLRKVGYPDPIDAGKVENAWEGVRHVHGSAKDKNKPRRYWHGDNLYDIVENLGARYPFLKPLKQDYEVYYVQDSDIVHASVRAIAPYLARAGSGWVLCPEPPPGDRSWLLMRAAQHLLLVVAVVNDAFSLCFGRLTAGLQHDIAVLFKPLRPRKPA